MPEQLQPRVRAFVEEPVDADFNSSGKPIEAGTVLWVEPGSLGLEEGDAATWQHREGGEPVFVPAGALAYE